MLTNQVQITTSGMFAKQEPKRLKQEVLMAKEHLYNEDNFARYLNATKENKPENMLALKKMVILWFAYVIYMWLKLRTFMYFLE